jgi:redox-sensitive bicupin YhaK (pirin superfamily)
MIAVRKAGERGHANYGWLDTYHTFSFANYYDRRHVHFRSLRVINEDRVSPGAGFDTHGHRDMEILTYVLEGALEHRDSLGNGTVIRAGDLQRLSAGTGVFHSEFNPSPTDPVHFFQIWILPARAGAEPGYEQKSLALEKNLGSLRPVASPAGGENVVTLHQDVTLHAGILPSGTSVTHRLLPGRHAWIQVAGGALVVNGEIVGPGDGLAVVGEENLTIESLDRAEILLFDLA